MGEEMQHISFDVDGSLAIYLAQVVKALGGSAELRTRLVSEEDIRLVVEGQVTHPFTYGLERTVVLAGDLFEWKIDLHVEAVCGNPTAFERFKELV